MNVKARLAELFTLNGLIWLPLLIGIAGVLGCAAAGYLALAPIWGPAWAALCAGLGLLMVAGVLTWLVSRRLAVPPPQPVEEGQAGQAPTAWQPWADEAASWVRTHQSEALLGAAAAGALLAASPTARRALSRTVAPLVMRGATQLISTLSDSRSDGRQR